jgi:hypothetical protein
MALYTSRRTALRLDRTLRAGLALYLCFAAILAAIAVPAQPARAGTYPGKIGVGLEGIGGRGLEFVDAAKTLRPWELIGGGAAPKDASGWPTSDARTVFFDMRPTFAWAPPIDDPDAYQINVSGTYKLSFTGQADLSAAEDAASVTIANKSYNATTNTSTADITLASGKALLVINFSNTRRTAASATNTGITNVKLIRPGYAATTTQTFHTPFLNAIQNFSTLRFMDWLDTNHNPGYYGDPGHHALNWADRRLPTDATQLTDGTKYGVAWEYVVELANISGKDIWITIPVAATDDYVRQLARFLKANLTNPNAKIYLEHSNEVWNFGFGQYTYNKLAAEDEVGRGGSVLNNDGSTDREQWARRRHAKHTRDIGQIFQSEFGAGTLNTKLFPVMSWWTIQPGQYEDMLQWLNNTYGAPRNYLWAIAGASYFNCGSVCTSGTVDQLIAALRQSSDGARSDRQAHSNTATRWGIKHFMYEGGPDSGGGDPTNVANRIRAHRDPRMKDLILNDIDANWFPLGGDLFMYFTLTSAYSRYGMWGITDDVTNMDRNSKNAAIKQLLGIGTTPTPPSAPGGLQATAGNAQVRLSWNASTGATSYTVKRGSSNGGPYTSIASNLTTTSYTNTGLSNGSTYYYVVTASNSAGESANSSQVAATPTSTPVGSGSITREYWSNVSGTTVATIPVNTAPSGTSTLTSLEAPTNWADNYGTRIRGYITAPANGSYVFWIASDDDSELYLSTSDSPASKSRIAYVSGWTNSREWNKYSTQKSAAISLTAGNRYYVEVLQKEGGGGDNLAVGWLKPGQSDTAPSEVVPGSQLSPYSVSTPAAPANLSASAGNAQVSLSWSASTGATGYNVKRTTGGNYVTIASNVTATSYTDTGLSNGTTYYYIVTAVNSAGESSPSNQASATPGSGGTVLAADSFSGAAGTLHNASGGSGWAANWEVQNGDTSVPGYNLSSGSLSYSTLAVSGNNASGGDSYQTAGRAFNTSSSGPFGSYLSNGLIGTNGSTLYLSALLRKDVANDEELSLTLHSGTTVTYPNPGLVSVGYFGTASNNGTTRYWSLKVGSTVYRTSVPITAGQTALLVLKLDFNPSSTASLYVNPGSLGGSAPSAPSAQGSATSSLAFRSLAFYGGNGFNQSALDEIRVGSSFAAVTPQ